jgi:hypothetical protein
MTSLLALLSGLGTGGGATAAAAGVARSGNGTAEGQGGDGGTRGPPDPAYWGAPSQWRAAATPPPVLAIPLRDMDRRMGNGTAIVEVEEIRRYNEKVEEERKELERTISRLRQERNEWRARAEAAEKKDTDEEVEERETRGRYSQTRSPSSLPPCSHLEIPCENPSSGKLFYESSSSGNCLQESSSSKNIPPENFGYENIFLENPWHEIASHHNEFSTNASLCDELLLFFDDEEKVGFCEETLRTLRVGEEVEQKPANIFMFAAESAGDRDLDEEEGVPVQGFPPLPAPPLGGGQGALIPMPVEGTLVPAGMDPSEGQLMPLLTRLVNVQMRLPSEVEAWLARRFGQDEPTENALRTLQSAVQYLDETSRIAREWSRGIHQMVARHETWASRLETIGKEISGLNSTMGEVFPEVRQFRVEIHGLKAATQELRNVDLELGRRLGVVETQIMAQQQVEGELNVRVGISEGNFAKFLRDLETKGTALSQLQKVDLAFSERLAAVERFQNIIQTEVSELRNRPIQMALGTPPGDSMQRDLLERELDELCARVTNLEVQTPPPTARGAGCRDYA